MFITNIQTGESGSFELRREKTGLCGFQPGQTQTGLYSHRRWLEAWNFRFKAWSQRRTDMYRKENGLKYAEFGYPVTKLISSATQSSRDRYVEPGS